ncbi:MAG: trypsin-like peptidase domain-containing protein, partial [Bacteroidota bacterium]
DLNKELTEYFDSSFVRCNKNKAAYYRKITYKEDHISNGYVKDYFESTSSLWRKVKFSYVDYEDESLSYFDVCDYDFYYANGALESTFKIGYEGYIIGKANLFYENGALKELRNYNRYGELDGHSVILDKNGKLERYGNYDSNNLTDDCYFNINQDGFWSKVFFENFNKNLNDWKKSEFVNTYYDILIINNKQTKSYFNFKPFPIDAANQFTLSSTFSTKKKTFRKNDFIGLIFDYKDNTSYSVLLVDGSNTAYIISYVYNKPKLIAKHKLKLKKSEFVEYDLTINFFKEGIRFNVNNQLIHLMPNWNWTGGKEFGITITGGGKFFVKEIAAIEYYDIENYNEWTGWVENKVLNDNPADYDVSGSGFFISQEGHLVTNYHVIENASSIDIELKMAGETVSMPAKVVIKDKTNDLAILKIVEKDFKFDDVLPYVINFQTMDVGTEVFTLGYPLIEVMGSEIKFTDGKISSKSGIDGDITTYQITTPIQKGNSGGPLFNENGEIVGIIVSTLNRENFNAENVNFALKSNLLKNLIDSSSEKINLPESNLSSTLKLSEKIKLFQNFIPIIKVKE